MRKSLCLIIILLEGVMSCFAQDILLHNPGNRGYFGVRASAELICPGDFKVGYIGANIFKNGVGAELGFIYNLPIVANFYVEPGVKLFYNAYSAKEDVISVIPNNFGKFSKLSYTKFGIRAPIVAGYHLDFTEDFKVAFFTGLELENSLSGVENYIKDGKNFSNNIFSGNDGMERFTTLWVCGCGVSYLHFHFDIHGTIGLVNLMRNHSYSFRENRVTFTLGYNF